MTHPAVKYGAITFVAIWFVGWITGMGGSWLPNLLFSAAMGIFAGLCYMGALWISGRGRD